MKDGNVVGGVENPQRQNQLVVFALLAVGDDSMMGESAKCLKFGGRCQS